MLEMKLLPTYHIDPLMKRDVGVLPSAHEHKKEKQPGSPPVALTS